MPTTKQRSTAIANRPDVYPPNQCIHPYAVEGTTHTKSMRPDSIGSCHKMAPTYVVISLACLALSSMLMPMTIEAGSLTITNKDCRKVVWFQVKKRANFIVSPSPAGYGCPKTQNVSINIGDRHTFDLGSDSNCSFVAYPSGTQITAWTHGTWPSDEDRSITCYEDWIDACHCPQQ